MVRDPLNQYWTRDVSTRLRVAVMSEPGGGGKGANIWQIS